MGHMDAVVSPRSLVRTRPALAALEEQVVHLSNLADEVDDDDDVDMNQRQDASFPVHYFST